MISVFEKMRREIDGSIVIISHQERILNIADEIVLIEGGKIKSHGKRTTYYLSYLQQQEIVNFIKEKNSYG